MMINNKDYIDARLYNILYSLRLKRNRILFKISLIMHGYIPFALGVKFKPKEFKDEIGIRTLLIKAEMISAMAIEIDQWVEAHPEFDWFAR